MKRSWIEPNHPGLSIRHQCELLQLNRATFYRQPGSESAANLALMRRIDEQFLQTPFYGSRRMAVELGTAADAAALAASLGKAVVRTLGECGAEAATGDGVLAVPAHPVAAIDTTAAGDCFMGVLAAGFDRGLALADALRRAAVAAALACTRHGSQGSLPLAAETDAAMQTGECQGRRGLGS